MGNINKLDISILERIRDPIRVLDMNFNVIYQNNSMRNLGFIDNFKKYININNLKNGIQIRETINGKLFSIGINLISLKQDNEEFIVEIFRDISEMNKTTLKLFGEVNRLNTDMRMAKRIQTSLLPKISDFGKVHFDYRYIPSDELSGDIFDIVKIDQDRFAIYIADVVGHGISASIMTMFVRQAFRSIIAEDKIYPIEVFSDLRERFDELGLDDGQYFSVFYGIFSIKENKFVYANAGHNCYPIILKDNGEIDYIISRGSLISSLVPKKKYNEETLYLKRSEKILFYTDGITELRDINGNFYGTEGLINVFKKSKNISLNEIIADAKYFKAGSQKDDIALLLMELR